MPHLHLPAGHSADDVRMAASLARALRCRELHVTWTAGTGVARPTAPGDAPHPRRRRLARVLGALAPRRGGTQPVR